MRLAHINGRWPLKLPEHRAQFHDERPWWEAARLADMAARKPGVIVDVGSEEGDLTALYASWGWVVHFIDPSLPWQTQTREIFRANGLTEGVSTLGFAADETVFRSHSDTAGFHKLEERPDLTRVRLDDFVGWLPAPPTAVTMDVEGSEERVLAGATELLKGDVMWWISIHGDVDPHASTPSEVHKLMRSFGYDDQFLAYDHEWHYRFWRPF